MGEPEREYVEERHLPAWVIEELLPDPVYQWRKDNPEADKPTFEEAEKIADILLAKPDPSPPFIRDAKGNLRIDWSVPYHQRAFYREMSRQKKIAWDFLIATRWFRKNPAYEDADSVLQEYWIPMSENDPDKWDVLEQIEAFCLMKRRLPPPAVADWRVEVIYGNRPEPPRRRGQKPRKSSRDARIIRCISFLQILGMTATRNDESIKVIYENGRERGDSACDVVAGVLGLSFKWIKAIWLAEKRKSKNLFGV